MNENVTWLDTNCGTYKELSRICEKGGFELGYVNRDDNGYDIRVYPGRSYRYFKDQGAHYPVVGIKEPQQDTARLELVVRVPSIMLTIGSTNTLTYKQELSRVIEFAAELQSALHFLQAGDFKAKAA